jgi:Protein of unknown function (DUF2934)
MMADVMHEERIRTLAYELWQKDGSPDGRADEYWEAARAQVENEGDAAATVAEGAFDEDVDSTGAA